MRSASAQLVKETRQLAWPWTILTLAGLLVLARPWMPALQVSSGPLHHLGDWVMAIGTFVGTLLLAVLPLGAEFQFRTLALRFAQPIDRRDLWRQKFVITLAAVVPPAVIYCFALRQNFGWPFCIMAASWIVVSTASAIPFTLIARSTIGGMVLTQLGAAGVTFGWTYYEKHGQLPTAWLVAMVIVLAAYAVFMVFLGRRMFLRFQAVDGMQAGEAFVPGARLLPHAVAEWFRCRPRQPLANLIRREFHLLRPLWLLAAMNLLAWALLVAFHLLPNQAGEKHLIPFALTACLGIVIAVLAGTLSLGEDKTWGTHDWHLTLPVSVSAQWGVKLLFALATSVVTAALLPMAVVIVADALAATPSHFLNSHVAVGWMLEAAGITLAAFWCACVVRGTVQATLWIFPLYFGIALAGGAPWMVADSTHAVQRLIAAIVRRLDPVVAWRAAMPIFNFLDHDYALAFIAVPLLGVALIQSHRLFRAQLAANRLRVVRCAIPLLLVAFLCSTIGVICTGLAYESWHQQSTIIPEVSAALSAAHAADPHPRMLSGEELANFAKLSDVTRHWLRDANVIVTAAPERIGNGSGRHLWGSMKFIVPRDKGPRVPYSALVRTERGTRCSLMLQIQKEGDIAYLTAFCE